jgi:uncharacterized protein
MKAGLVSRKLPLKGVPKERMSLYHLTGRETANLAHPNRYPFSLQFARLSPYTIMEMLGLNDAQMDRFLFAYDLAKVVLRAVGIFPQDDAEKEERDRQEQMLLRIDDLDRGYPRLTLSLFLDVVQLCWAKVTKGTFTPFNEKLKTAEAAEVLKKYLDPKQMPGSPGSWGKLRSILWRLHRLKVFSQSKSGRPMVYNDLVRPGNVSVVDLSGSGMAELTNIAVADILRGVQEAQEGAYRSFEKQKASQQEPTSPPRVLIIIEEAHEFLSAERIERTEVMFQQVTRIAKRGRKRWLGLIFVTQLPQHLPRQVLGLVNSFILHKITDPEVVNTLRKTVSGIDAGLWSRLPGLAPGQAIVSFPHMTRPLLVSMDPTGAKLRLAD